MAFYDSKVGKLYIAQYDVTGYTTEVTPKSERALREVTVLGDDGATFIPGTSADKLSWSGLFDDGATGSDVVMDALRSATVPQVVSVWNSDAVLGNRGYGSGQGWIAAPDIKSSVGSRVEMSGELEIGIYDRLKSLGPKSTVTATTNGSSLDDSASSSSGGSWVYHLFAVSATGGNAQWQIEFEDSADDVAFATVGSESVNVSAAGAARRTFTGTLRRYVRVRVVLDATSGSITFFAAYRRA